MVIHMYKVVKKSRAIQCIIIFLALLIMITIYPLRIWNETIPSVSNQILAGSSDSICEDYMLQRFIAQYDHLGTINLYVVDFENGWNKDTPVHTFIFRLMDSNMEILFEELVDVRFIDIPGFCPVYINEDLEVGKDYYFFLQGDHASRVWFGLEETATAGTSYVSRLVYNYDELEGYNIIGQYNYSVPLRKDKVFLYDAILLAITVLLVCAVELYYRISKRAKLITVEKALRVTANVLLGAGLVYGIWNISVRHFFSGEPVDNVFYTIGTLMGFGTLFYMVNVKRARENYIRLSEKLKANLQDILQTVFIAAGVWACCNYMNGLYEIHHRVAERQFVVFLALAAIVMCRGKEIFNKVTAVYAVAALGVTLWYRSIYVDYIAMDEWDLRILRWGIAAIILSGFLLVNIVMQLIVRYMGRKETVRTGLGTDGAGGAKTVAYRKEKLPCISWWYCGILGLFFVMIIVFRNTRWWTVVFAAAYTLFYIRFAFWDKKAHLLQNICNGLLLNFVCSMLFSFVRRPFLSFVYPRFPFIFHTVTVTAVYMTFIMCAALMKLADRYSKCVCGHDGEKVGAVQGLKLLWKELLLFGLSSAYMLFTASRTGFLAVAVMTLVTIVFFILGTSRKRAKKAVVLIIIMICSAVWCFPVAFTAQRIFPAMVNNIYRHEVEDFPDEITRGNEWDSMYFITVARFVEVFNNKIFGIDERGTFSYERSEEYQKYRAKRFNDEGAVVWDGSIEEMLEEENGNLMAGQGGSTAKDGAGSHDKLDIIGFKTEEERAADDAAAAQREEEALHVQYEKEKPKEEEEVSEDMSVYEKTEEYANGRMDIFRAYIDQLNLTGHNDMGAMLPNGSLAVHAHNIYLQAAYDHGIIVGVLFLFVGAAAFIQGCIFYKRRKAQVPCAALPAAAVSAFAMAGLVEWIFHLCHPASFVLMLVLSPLLFDMNGEQ